jgi:hypothetical protein
VPVHLKPAPIELFSPLYGGKNIEPALLRILEPALCTFKDARTGTYTIGTGFLKEPAPIIL